MCGCDRAEIALNNACDSGLSQTSPTYTPLQACERHYCTSVARQHHPDPSTAPTNPDANRPVSVPNHRRRRQPRTRRASFPSQTVDTVDESGRQQAHSRLGSSTSPMTPPAPSRSVETTDNPGRKQARLRPEPSTPPANPDAKTSVPVLNHRPARQSRTQTAHRRRQHHLSAPPCAYGAVNVGAVSSRIGSHEAWLVSGYMSSIMLMALSPMISRT